MKYDMPVKKNECYEVEIVDIGSDGTGIGKINEFTVFVENAVTGDIIDVLILKVKKSFAYGKIMNFKKKSSFRTEPICKHVFCCGGCQLQHISYEYQLQYKQKKVKNCLERIGGFENILISPIIGMKEYYYYRNKAQFPVAKKEKKACIGFFAKRSHNIIDIETCYLQQQYNDEVIKIMKSFLDNFQIPIYNEQTHTGIVRHVLTRMAFATREIMVCIVICGKQLPHLEELIKKLRTINGIVSIVINENNDRTNIILGEKTKTVWGKDTIIDFIGDIQFKISPLSFFQVNPIQTKILYEKALEFAQLTGKETVMDIYCGIGTISLFLAQKAKWVYGIEIVPQAIQNAQKNAQINKIENTTFLTGKAEEIIPELYEEGIGADVVVVDPPRKGCEEKVLETIIKMKAKTVVYVSCDPATLARDLKILVQNGFKVQAVQPVDQFPMTTHVETVVLLSLESSTL